MVWKKIASKFPSNLLGVDLISAARDKLDPLPTGLDGQPMPALLKKFGRDTKSSTSAWRQACSEYQQQLKLKAPLPQNNFFVGFGSLHLVVADILLERMSDIAINKGQRVVHITSASGLLAVYSRHEKLVQLRCRPAAALGKMVQMHELDLRVMPRSARLLEGVAACDFEPIAWTELIWYFGQNALQALTYVPDLQSQILRVGRFPSLEPACLGLRHLHLLHVLSQNNHRFEDLLRHLSDEQLATVCPDLAALYLTGAVNLKEA